MPPAPSRWRIRIGISAGSPSAIPRRCRLRATQWRRSSRRPGRRGKEQIPLTTGELLTRWTVRFALALYVAALALRISAHGRLSWFDVARFLWTAGCVAFLLHVACAFQFFHQWSHAAAYAETGRQTAELVGIDWGGGLYANYVFAGVWLADVIWWWVRPVRYLARPCWMEWAVQGFMAFIAFNATVVFGSGAVRWFGLAGCVLVAAAGWIGKARAALPNRRAPTPPPFRGEEWPKQ